MMFGPASNRDVPGEQSFVTETAEFTGAEHSAVADAVTVRSAPDEEAASAVALLVKPIDVVTNSAVHPTVAPGAILAATTMSFGGVCVPVAPGFSRTTTSYTIPAPSFFTE